MGHSPRCASFSADGLMRDYNGQALAYVYFEDEPERRTATRLRQAKYYERHAATFLKNRKDEGAAPAALFSPCTPKKKPRRSDGASNERRWGVRGRGVAFRS